MLRRLGGLVVLTLAASGCGGPVEIDVPDLSAADRAACEALADDLPDTLGEQERVDVEPADAPGAAYGDPAIVVTCGVDEPAGFGATGQCELVNGVGWYIPDEQYDDQDLDLTLTSAGYRPRVEVVMPADYRGTGLEAGIMAVLAPLVDEHTTRAERCV